MTTDNGIVITSDSTCDLGNRLISENGIRIMPLTVMLGSKSYKDGIDITPDDIFNYFEDTGELPKTAAPSVEDYEKFFEGIVNEGKDVIHFNISSKASGSNGFAVTAQKKFGDKVRVIDSLALSTGQGLLVMKACDLRAEGKSSAEIESIVNDLREKVNTSFVPDTLLYLYKGGRCSTLSYYGSKVLSIHPQISMKEGQLYPKKKYIGKMSRCLRNYVKDLAEEYKSYDTTRCFITHSGSEPELVEEVRQQVKEFFHFDEIIETVAGSIITSHCGKNTLGVLFICK